MADLKRCDRCGDVWEPEVVNARSFQHGVIQPLDKNLCNVNYALPADSNWRPVRESAWKERDAHADSMELCRRCGIALNYFLHPEPGGEDDDLMLREKAQGRPQSCGDPAKHQDYTGDRFMDSPHVCDFDCDHDDQGRY